MNDIRSQRWFCGETGIHQQLNTRIRPKNAVLFLRNEFVDRNCIVFTVHPIVISEIYSWTEELFHMYIFFSLSLFDVDSSAFAAGPIHPNNK